MAFWASLSGSSADICADFAVECAVFISTDGVISKVIAAGDTGPPGVGGTVSALGTIPLINGSGQLTVWTGISNGFSSQALVLVMEGVVDNVVAVGNPEPLPLTGTFDDFIDAVSKPTVSIPNNVGQVAFWGEVDDSGIKEATYVTAPPPSVMARTSSSRAM